MEENSRTIQVEVYKENGMLYVYFSEEGSSGVKYQMNSIAELGSYMDQYVRDYLPNW